MSELPKGWAATTLGMLVTYAQRGKSPLYVDKSDLPVVNQKCVRWAGIDQRHLKFVHPDQWAQWGAERSLQDGDILWNSTGTGTIGRAAIFRGLREYSRTVADSHVTVIRVANYDPNLLHYWIMSPMVQERIEKMQTGSTNQVELSREAVLNTDVIVPPLPEQRRIVAKLDALTTRSRRAKEALDAIPALLDNFRQSVLAAAFRGDLTAAWREKTPDVEPAEKLLERIRHERRRRWEESELAKMIAKGKKPGDDRWKQKYEEPSAVDADGLPELPEGWCWGRIGDLGEDPFAAVQTGPFGALLHSSEFVDSGVPVIAVGNLTGVGFTEQGLYYVTAEKAEQLANYSVNAGDVLFARSGATLGKVCVAPPNVSNWRMTGHILRLRLRKGVVLPELVVYALWGAPSVKEQVNSGIRGMTRPGYNTELLERILVPVAPYPEQVQVCKAISSAFARIDAIAARREELTRDMAELDRATLAKAFRGELVPQDPNDEPASVLLERLRAERAKGEAGGGGKKRKKS